MRDTILIRPATVSDIPALATLAAATFYDTYAAFNTVEDMDKYISNYFNVNTLQDELHDPAVVVLMAYSGTEAVGYTKLNDTGSSYIPEIPAMEIARYYVSASAQGSGIGKAMMDTVMKIAAQRDKKALWLGVWQRNSRAVDIYTHLGFRIVGTTTFTLGDDVQEDYVMVKML